MADRSWKAFERRVARLVGGYRVGPDHRKAGSDVNAPLFCYQNKLTKGDLVVLRRWLDGICQSASHYDHEWCGGQAIGVVVQKAPRVLDVDALVTLRLGDWLDILAAVDMVKLAQRRGSGISTRRLARVRKRLSR